LLFGVTPGDPLTLVAVLITVLLGGLAAAGLPALRATRADPVAVLRAE
jgi:ABC-type antimicrobial peptide transport system permease subunit